MTLIGAILKKVKSQDSITSKNKYTSPPPETTEGIEPKRKKKHIDLYGHVRARVSTSPPRYFPTSLYYRLPQYTENAMRIWQDNIRLLYAISHAGKVDSYWKVLPQTNKQYYQKRIQFAKKTERDNRTLYKLIKTAIPKVQSTSSLRRDWVHNRRVMVEQARRPFVLFPRPLLEDPAFIPSPGFRRPIVSIFLSMAGEQQLGKLRLELFTDVCPNTCQLFTELLAGDGGGYGYVGTTFFRKVPGLYWSGGDVVHDNGFGCYAQSGRRMPIGAENYHFSHSIPGLLSMRVTKDDEMCGIFNITFKPLPQLDLSAVVFGRVIRPCSTYDMMQGLGEAISPRPVIRLAAARLSDGKTFGVPNTRIADARIKRFVIRPCSTYDMMQGLGEAISPRPVIRLAAARLSDGKTFGVPNTRIADARIKRFVRPSK